jgi:hypothetical protein
LRCFYDILSSLLTIALGNGNDLNDLFWERVHVIWYCLYDVFCNFVVIFALLVVDLISGQELFGATMNWDFWLFCLLGALHKCV